MVESGELRELEDVDDTEDVVRAGVRVEQSQLSITDGKRVPVDADARDRRDGVQAQLRWECVMFILAGRVHSLADLWTL